MWHVASSSTPAFFCCSERCLIDCSNTATSSSLRLQKIVTEKNRFLCKNQKKNLTKNYLKNSVWDVLIEKISLVSKILKHRGPRKIILFKNSMRHVNFCEFNLMRVGKAIMSMSLVVMMSYFSAFLG